jgi:hypothetical protein
MSHIKHVFMSCLLALAALGLQAATPMSVAKTAAPAEQPVPPFTVTVKQTGTPSLKTFYKVPVEISLTNNMDREFQGTIHFRNFSAWLSNNIKDGTARILALACVPLVAHSIASGLTSMHHDLVCSFVMMSLMCQGALREIGNRIYSLKPHETIARNGYISKNDMEKIQNGQLEPKVYGKTIGTLIE